ncbi:MAG: hypothetical protein ACYTJ0_00175 [Planctomycetota bacterium]|jgi:hypothetical protein
MTNDHEGGRKARSIRSCLGAACATALVLVLTLSGCSAYTLRGKVVQSDFGTISFVDSDDERLSGKGLGSVEVKVYRDPTRPNTELVARALSDGEGNVSIPLAAFGAGWMVEQWRITATRGGHQTVDLITALPAASDNKSILIMLAPGYSPPSREDEDLMQLYREFK